MTFCLLVYWPIRCSHNFHSDGLNLVVIPTFPRQFIFLICSANHASAVDALWWTSVWDLESHHLCAWFSRYILFFHLKTLYLMFQCYLRSLANQLSHLLLLRILWTYLSQVSSLSTQIWLFEALPTEIQSPHSHSEIHFSGTLMQQQCFVSLCPYIYPAIMNGVLVFLFSNSWS